MWNGICILSGSLALRENAVVRGIVFVLNMILNMTMCWEKTHTVAGVTRKTISDAASSWKRKARLDSKDSCGFARVRRLTSPPAAVREVALGRGWEVKASDEMKAWLFSLDLASKAKERKNVNQRMQMQRNLQGIGAEKLKEVTPDFYFLCEKWKNMIR